MDNDILSDDWQPPFEFRRETPMTVVRWWFRTKHEATGTRPNANPFSLVKNAEFLIAKLGFGNVMRTLAFMATPLSKYYQWPYGLGDVIENAYTELTSVKQLVAHSGYVGPVGMKNLVVIRQKRMKSNERKRKAAVEG